jgi:hypothetical protein
MRLGGKEASSNGLLSLLNALELVLLSWEGINIRQHSFTRQSLSDKALGLSIVYKVC